MILSWFFFFKQKTAYEMRISDWSSDVCSSDLDRQEFRPQVAAMREQIILHLAYADAVPGDGVGVFRPDAHRDLAMTQIAVVVPNRGQRAGPGAQDSLAVLAGMVIDSIRRLGRMHPPSDQIGREAWRERG